MSRKVLIFGIDGGTWKILKPLMREGLLPTLSRLTNEGSSGILRSTLPPVTAPAWTTFQTGVSPIEHGIIDFLNFERSERTCNLINATSIKYPTLWQLASKAGMRVVSINVPVTYPPQEINGYMISGLLTPSIESNFTHPAELKEEIMSKFGRYSIFVSHDILKRKGLRKFVKELIDTEDLRTKIALYLMNKSDWNIFMVHNQSSDSLQHAVWPFIEPQSSEFDPEIFQVCVEFYKAMDNNISKLINQAGDAAIIVMSDHGFGPLKKTLNINKWLIEEGFITLKRSSIKKAESLIRKLDRFKIARRIIPVRKREKIRRSLDLNHYLDWKLTKAFVPYGSLCACLYVNSEDKEEIKAILDELSERILKIKDPETGNKVVRRLVITSRLYSPDNSLPDAIIEPEDGYSFNSSMVRESLFYTPRFRMGAIGRHEMEGIIILSDKISPFIQGKIENEMNIKEVVPTILSFLGVPLPFYMES